MKIRMLTSIAGNADPRYGLDSFSFAPNAVVDVHKNLAAAWIASGAAEKVKGNAATPEAAEAEPVAEAAAESANEAPAETVAESAAEPATEAPAETVQEGA
jgi:hypothetical protein